MMRNVFIAALLMVVPFNLMAQDDDMYFVPSKKAKQEAREKAQQARETRYVTVIYEPEDDYMAQEDQPDFHTGALRDVDEYNRRGHNHPSSFGEVHVGNDTLYITEEQLALEDSIRNLSKYREQEEEEYNYSGRLVRFHGGVRSPYYWDYYYDWAYDPFFYDPFYYNSWYYGPGYYGWYGPYNSAWYRHGWYGWYDPWYDYSWGWGGYYGSYYYGGYYGPGWGHIGHGGGWYDRPLARRSEAARNGGRRSSSGISASRGNGISANRASRSGNLGGTRGNSSISVNEPRTGGINNLMRRDGLNMSTRGTRDINVNGTTRSQQTTTRVPNNSRTNNTNGISSQRAARQESTYTPPTTPTRSTTTTSSFSSGSSMGGSRGGGSMGGGSFGGGGSRGGGSSRGGR